MSVARSECDRAGERVAGEKVVLPRSERLLETIEREWAGDDPFRWKMLVCLHLRSHCRWELELIGRAFGHDKGHALRLIQQATDELREGVSAGALECGVIRTTDSPLNGATREYSVRAIQQHL